MLAGVIFNYDTWVQIYDICYIAFERPVKRPLYIVNNLKGEADIFKVVKNI